MRFHRLLIVALSLLTCVFGALHFSSRIKTRRQEQVLEIEHEDLQMGRIAVPSLHSLQLHIRNTSERQVSIRSIVGSCSCTSIHPSSFAIGGLRSRDIAVVLDLTDRLPIHEEEFSIDLIVGTNEYPGTEFWRLTGEIWSPIRAIHERYVSQGGARSTRSLEIDFTSDIAAVTIANAPTLFSSTLSRAPQNPQLYVLTLEPTAERTAGRVEDIVELSAEMRSGASVLLNLPLRVYLEPEIASQPSHLLPGILRQHTPWSEVISIRSRSGSELHGVSAVASDDVHVASVPSSDPSALRFRVTVTPSWSGAFEEELIVRGTIAESDQAFELIVPITAAVLAVRSEEAR